MDPSERERLMVECYGEACSFVVAGKVIGRSPATIRKMAGDGRIRFACEGTRIDVRSLARYICAPKQIDSDARLRKRRERNGVKCEWRVWRYDGISGGLPRLPARLHRHDGLHLAGRWRVDRRR